MTQSYSLDGQWRFTRLSESTLDQRSIRVKNPKTKKIQVPSNWYLQGEDFAGEALYETEFEIPQLQPGQAAFLRFKGSDYFTKAELNGKLLGLHEGYFQTFDLAATQALEVENRLRVWVESPKENRKDWPHRKQLIKGIFNHHDTRPGSWDEERGQDHNSGGLWNGVELLVAERVFLKNVKIHPVLLSNGQAVVQFKLTLLNVADADDYDIELKVSGEGFQGFHELKKNLHLERGQSEAHLSLTLKKPRLWWTWDQGEPALYRAHLGVRRTKTGKIVEEKNVRFGVRDIKVTPEWEFILNGRKFFPRGTNIIPTQWLSSYQAGEARRDVRLMKEANLNAVRVHAHVNRAEFYDACDEAGIFVWQDFALQWSYEPSDTFTRNACRQIKDMVRQLYNHPSIFVWCCHNEPSFNRHELDPVLERAVKEEDSSRFVDTASDFHFHPYPGWYWDDSAVRDVPGTLGPETQFLSEFGAQGLPSVAALKKMFKPGELWPPDWKAWAFRDFQYFQTFNVARIDRGKTLAEFVENSQRHQAWLVKEYIQSIRLKKYKPMKGYFHFMFVDCWPSITWSVVDYHRTPKKGYETLKTASQPLLPLWRPIITQFNPGDMLSWGQSLLEGVWMINDYPHAFKGLKVELRVVGPKEKLIFKDAATCDLEADSLAKPFESKERLAHIKGFAIPKNAKPGEYQVRLAVFDKKGKKIAHNETSVQVVKRKF